MSARTLVVGLDGAEPRLLKSLAEQGQLPTIKHLFDSSSTNELATPKAFGDGVFWSSIYTGASAGEHGYYFAKHFNPNTYQVDDFDLDLSIKQEPFWQYCSRAGASVGVIDLYTSSLRTGVNGFQVMDWMIHARTGKPRSWPAALINNLHQQYMEDPLVGISDVESRTDKQWLQFHQNIFTRIEAKSRATCDLLEQNNFDLFCVGFCDLHDIGHQSWHWHDKDHARHPDDLVSQHGDPIVECYVKIDAALNSIISAADADNVFVICGNGMRRQASCNPALQEVLGHLCGIKGSRQYITQQRRLMPYFEVPHNMHAGAIRLNLKGREALGIIDKEDYDDTCKQLIHELTQLTDTKTDHPVVDKVVKVHDEFPGDRKNQLPDLMVIWRTDHNAQQIKTSDGTLFDITPVFNPEKRSGDHSNSAILFSTQRFPPEGEIPIEAIASSICRSIGVNMPRVQKAKL